MGYIEVGYILLFTLLYQVLGPITAAISVLPAAAGGWIFGLGGGVISAVITFTLNIALLMVVGDFTLLGALASSSVGSTVVILMGALSGWVRNLHLRVREQTLALTVERDHLTREMAERRRIEREREELIAQLQEALSNIKVLGGLLPICPHCKRIRDDRGYWNQVESYLRERSDALFSHSLCPTCADDFYEPGDEEHQLSPLDLNRGAELLGSALWTWTRLHQASVEELASFLECSTETLLRLADIQRPTSSAYRDDDLELIAASLSISFDALRRLLDEVEADEARA